jgi:hypothetical protein
MHVIEVLGPGCQKCQYTERVVREVVERAGIEAQIRHVTDYGEIASWREIRTAAQPTALDISSVLTENLDWPSLGSSARSSRPPRRHRMEPRGCCGTVSRNWR